MKGELARSYATGVEELVPLYWRRVVEGSRGGRWLMVTIVFVEGVEWLRCCGCVEFGCTFAWRQDEKGGCSDGNGNLGVLVGLRQVSGGRAMLGLKMGMRVGGDDVGGMEIGCWVTSWIVGGREI